MKKLSFVQKAKSLTLSFLFLLIPQLSLAAPADDFVITVKTDNSSASSSDTQFTIPTTGSGYNYNVDCDNDGTNEATAQTGNYTCNYVLAGTYTIRIKDNSGLGTGFPRIYFNRGDEGQDYLKIISLGQWGTGKWTSMHSAFRGAYNMVVPALDTPDLSAVTDMSSMFDSATAANPDTSSWDTSSVTDMSSMFSHSSVANPDTSSWDTSSVTDMSDMFSRSSVANPDTSSWDTSSVTDMSSMFSHSSVANPDTSSWDTSSVTYMGWMFESTSAANPNTSNWNVGAVTNMYRMFNGVTLPTASYDAILTGFNAQTLQPNVEFDGGNSTYCGAASARANIVSTYGWDITDGGQDCSPAMPVVAPDLQAASDSGSSDSDNITNVTLPSFGVACSETGHSITLYTDNPAANTSIGTHTCSAVATETITAATALASGNHTISYTETTQGESLLILHLWRLSLIRFWRIPVFQPHQARQIMVHRSRLPYPA